MNPNNSMGVSFSTHIRVFGELSDYPHVVHQIPHYPVPHVIVEVTCGLRRR
jgi:hypothetical protein